MKGNPTMKKTLSLLLALTMVLTAACSSSKPVSGSEAPTLAPASDVSKEEAQGEKKEDVTLSFICFGEVKTEIDYFKQAIEDYKQIAPNVKIEVEFLPHADLVTKVNVAYASGAYPDLIYTPIGELMTWAAKGQIEPLDSYLDEYKMRDRMIPNVMDLTAYKGSVYGIGVRSEPRVLMYRKDMFEAAGLDPEKPPKTWEELSDYAQKLTMRESNGTYKQVGFDLYSQGAQSPFVWQAFVEQNGGTIFDVDTDTLTVNNPQAIEALQFFIDLYAKGVCPPMNGNTQSEWPFVKGYSAMAYMGGSAYNDMIKNDPSLKEKVGFSIGPERVKKSVVGGMITLALGSESKHKDEAAAFLNYLSSDEEYWKRVEQINCPPLVNSLKDQYIALEPELNAITLEALNYALTRPRTTWSSVYTTNENLMFESALTGGVPADKAIADLEAVVLKEINKSK